MNRGFYLLLRREENFLAVVCCFSKLLGSLRVNWHCSLLSQVNGNGILGPSQGNTENSIHHTKALMDLSGAGDTPSLGFANEISDFSKHVDKSGKRR